jgi:hypothetical protein
MNPLFGGSPAATGTSICIVFALCLYLTGAAERGTARFDAIGPGGFVAAYVVEKAGENRLRIRQEDGDSSRVLYEVEVVDASRGAYRFANADTGKKDYANVSQFCEGTDHVALKASRGQWIGLITGEGVDYRRSGEVGYLKATDLDLTYVLHPPAGAPGPEAEAAASE